MYANASLARVAAGRIVAQYPDALLAATPIRQPGVEPRFAPAVSLKPGAALRVELAEVVMLDAVEEAEAVPAVVKRPVPRRDTPRPPRAGTQRARIIETLSRPEGTSVSEIIEEFGLPATTVRGMVSVLRRDMGIERDEDGRYRLI